MTQAIAKKREATRFSLYLSLTKPGIVSGNMLSAFAGYLIAARGVYDLVPFCLFTIGLAMVMGAACVFNNCFDAELDRNMVRTRNRALPKGTIEKKQAFYFGLVLLFLGAFSLCMVNRLAVSLAFFGLFFYVAIYTLFKYVSPHATLVGAIPGAIPPLIGYVTSRPLVDFPFLLLFFLLVFWQMPHFYAISLFRLEEFRKARIPVFPLKKGIAATKVQMFLFSLAFTATIVVFASYVPASRLFLVSMGISSLYWNFQCLAGFWRKDTVVWARSVFGFSIALMLIFAVTSFFCT
ncbi:MAG: heme o synthase [Chlamydiota bacterium]